MPRAVHEYMLSGDDTIARAIALHNPFLDASVAQAVFISVGVLATLHLLEDVRHRGESVS